MGARAGGARAEAGAHLSCPQEPEALIPVLQDDRRWIVANGVALGLEGVGATARASRARRQIHGCLAAACVDARR